jgi:hypothetical protein
MSKIIRNQYLSETELNSEVNFEQRRATKLDHDNDNRIAELSAFDKYLINSGEELWAKFVASIRPTQLDRAAVDAYMESLTNEVVFERFAKKQFDLYSNE